MSNLLDGTFLATGFSIPWPSTLEFLVADQGLLAQGLLAQVATGSNSAVIAFTAYIAMVMFLAWLSSRVRSKTGFLNEYFLGGRTLGVWTFALTFAATSASGGSFIGFPSLVYVHGWSVALWISSYMLVPLVAMGLLAKRLNQISRKTDAITIPDLIFARFESPVLCLISTGLIVFFMTFNLIAQFKGGSIILQTLLSDVPLFQAAVQGFSGAVGNPTWLPANVDPAYLLCLLVFALAVVAYTTYGGFRAVVWTDVLQGIVMVVGILILLPLSLIAVGGLPRVTELLASATPARTVDIAISNWEAPFEGPVLPKGTILQASQTGRIRHFRLEEAAQFSEFGRLLPVAAPHKTSSVQALAFETTEASQTIADDSRVFIVDEFRQRDFAYGPKGAMASVPGPSENRTSGFLPAAAALSFFFYWCFASAGQPSNMVRCMAFRDSKTLSRAIFTVSIYYSLIYFPIVIIFCCAKILLPGWENASDRIMPEMASTVTSMFGVPWLAGLLIAAPFAAVMSTMDSFLLMISSSVVRDIYQKWINPNPSQARIRMITYTTTLCVGLAAMLAAVSPPRFLQDIIVFTGAGLATSFLAPVSLGLYWPRFNHQGAIAAMLAGFLSNIALYAIGSIQAGEMSAYEPLGLHPFLVGAICSMTLGIAVCLLTPPPATELVRRFFCRKITIVVAGEEQA